MSATKLDVRKWARRALIAIAALYGLYLLAIHLVLATPLLRHFTNKNSEKFLLEYGSAWSLVPGRVHVRGLRLRLKDSVAEVYIAADRVDAKFDLFALAKKTLRVREAKIAGVAVRVRERMLAEDISPRALEGVAEIPGFDGPPLKSVKPREAPELGKYWKVDLSAIHIDPLRELWIGPFRFAGDAVVDGGFYLEPLRQFELRPSKLYARDGTLTLAKRPFARAIRGPVAMSIARHDPLAIDGIEFFRFVDAHLEVASEVEGLGFSQRWLPPLTSTSVVGGAGLAKGDVRVVAGVLQDGSKLQFQFTRAIVRQPPLVGTLDAELALAVERRELRAGLTLKDLRVERRYAESYPIKAERLDVVAVSRSLDLARGPLDDVLATLDLPRATLTDTRILTGLVGDGLKLRGGVASAKVHLDLSVREKLLQGEFSFDAPKLAVQSDDVAFAAHVATELRFKALDLTTMRGAVPAAFLDIRDATLTGSDGPPPPSWWGRIDVANGTLDAAQKPMFAGDLKARARDARPIVYLATKGSPLPNWAREPLAMEGLTVAGKLHVGPGVALESFTGEGGSIELKGRAKKVEKKTEGHVTLSYGPFALTIQLGPKSGVGGGPKTK